MYELLSTGRLVPEHADHPSTRRAATAATSAASASVLTVTGAASGRQQLVTATAGRTRKVPAELNSGSNLGSGARVAAAAAAAVVASPSGRESACEVCD